MHTGCIRIEETNRELKRKNLAAVDMTRELKVKPVDRLFTHERLVLQEDHERVARRRTERHILVVKARLMRIAARPVVHAGENDGGSDVGCILTENPEACESMKSQRCFFFPVVFVIAEYGKFPEWRVQFGERFRKVLDVRKIGVDQIASGDDRIGFDFVQLVEDLAQQSRSPVDAQVQVGDLCQPNRRSAPWKDRGLDPDFPDIRFGWPPQGSARRQSRLPSRRGKMRCLAGRISLRVHGTARIAVRINRFHASMVRPKAKNQKTSATHG